MNNYNQNLLKCLLLLLLIFCNVAFFSRSTFANQYNMNKENIVSLIEQARTAWIAQDADALTEMFTPDGEFIVPGQKWQGQARIREELTNFSQQYSNVKIDIRRILVENNQASVEWYYEDIEKSTGHCNQADDVIVIDFKDGRISRWREYFDTETPTRNQ